MSRYLIILVYTILIMYSLKNIYKYHILLYHIKNWKYELINMDKNKLAIIISFFLPGIGHAMKGKKAFGISSWIVVLFLTFFLYYLTEPNPWFSIIFYFTLGFFVAYGLSVYGVDN